jgi:cysteine desulfurase family protein
MIYFDQAASSFPKPKEVTDAMVKMLTENGANPGRGGHAMARDAAAVVQRTRETTAQLFGCSDPKKVLFYQNATAALNQAVKGLEWKEGDHILTTSAEHNSIRRPLEYVKDTYGVQVTYVDWKGNETDFLEDVSAKMNKKTKLLAITHASNVTGTILPLEKLTVLAKQHGVLTLADASQTAGHVPVSMQKQGIDMLAFPGHKGLLGPQGTGMLLIEGEIELKPLHHGGTGSFSEARTQPEQWPEKLESGTLNTPGIAGLLAALNVYEREKDEIVSRETMLADKLITGLQSVEGVICYQADNLERHLPIAAFNIAGADSQEIAMILDSHYHIAVRAGLHCSPLTHQAMGTLEQGVIRVSMNRYNTEKEIDAFLQAVQEMAAAYKTM